MPVETDTSTSSSGGTTTVGADVRDGGGPGSPAISLDVYLHLDPAKLEQVSDPTSSTTVTPRIDKDRLSAYWKDVKLVGGGSLSFNWRVKKRSGDAFEGASDGLLVVVDRTTGGEFVVRRFCICGNTGRFVMFDKFGPFDLSKFHELPGVLRKKSKKKKAAKKKARKTTKKPRKTAPRRKKKVTR